MIYRNTKTGAIINSPCSISGGNWKLAEEIEEEVVEVEEEIEEEVVEVEEEIEEEVVEEKAELTKKEIMRELDAFGIEYNPKMTKAELLELMKEG